MKFLVDMNLSPLWCEVLVAAGWFAVHWRDVGECDASDQHLLEYAQREGLIVFTHDLDFGTLLDMSGGEGPSVVQIREQNIDPAVIGEVVVLALRQCQEALGKGCLLSIDLRRAKARMLPLR
ncbi:MAG TPA: DUF5615 family PIN-like protein [Fimbriimonadaceae bacterium]|nr:DUF5615 family PIN-like protein [Fimbriimonadaceae bacterium]